uniref:COesterase domain-containing protein n=1 Tax=Steinernema glaseri TaxID=37863 RepID=A0A1I8AKT7_9BILA
MFHPTRAGPIAGFVPLERGTGKYYEPGHWLDEREQPRPVTEEGVYLRVKSIHCRWDEDPYERPKSCAATPSMTSA